MSRASIGRAACAVLMAAGLGTPVPGAAAPKRPVAKNVILLISDGTGHAQIQAANLYAAGRLVAQPYEHFPFRFAVSTYPGSTSIVPDCAAAFPGSYDPALFWADFDYAKLRYTDSAAAATSMATGVKTYNNAIGKDLCGEDLENAVERGETLGKATGVVTTVPISHATPAGFVAHDLSRDEYQAIAEEMILSSATDVIMGAGNPWYDENGAPVVTPSFQYVGQGTWDAAVAGTAGADADGDGVADPWTLIQTRAEFQALGSGPTPARVLGVATVHSTLQQLRGGDAMADPFVVPLDPNVPTLAEMTAAAMNVLDEDPDGFFLMVEGGAVDWAGHLNEPGRMIEERLDFNAAVQTVLNWVEEHSNWGETLVIVTGDHETGYLTGPGSDPTWEPLVDNGAGVLPGMEFHFGSHTNSLVPLFAKGDAARLFSRYADQHDPVRGPYVDNTEIAKVVFAAMTGSE